MSLLIIRRWFVPSFGGRCWHYDWQHELEGKSHTVIEDAVTHLSYADAAKNTKKYGGHRDSGNKKRVILVSTATNFSFRRETTRDIWPNAKAQPFPKTEKPCDRNKKFRLVPNPNTLDSRAPQLIRRGKERTKDRKKKESKLKRTILEARSRETKCITPTAEIHEEASGDSQVKPTQLESSTKDNKVCVNLKQQGQSMKRVKYREYCDMYVTKSVNTMTETLLSELMRFQERVRKTKPAKAKAKRRLVIGLKETTQCLQVVLTID
ncbi:Selenocysteine insertion sequence-binding protein 2 [Galdieria sulphuraria]|nr:Selenocysteine insertion sequence-binding protein 2 [Galdieria sulphuraria]